jgi:hypothetical protein
MSDVKWTNTGEQIKDALTEALNSGDFKELNTLVAQTVTNALNEAGKNMGSNNNIVQNSHQEASGYGNQAQSEIPIWQQRAQERARQKAAMRQGLQYRKQQRMEQLKQEAVYVQQQTQQRTEIKQTTQTIQTQAEPAQTTGWSTPKTPTVKMRKVGKVSNVLYQVFGGIGLGITGLITLIRLFVFLAGDTTLAGWIINFIFLAFFYGMVQVGIGQRQRLKRALRYVQLCGHKMYGDIEQLALSVGKNVRFVTKDIRKMLNAGIFPEGHLDKQKTCLMLNDSIYRQYLETEGNRRRNMLESPAETSQKESAAEQQEESDSREQTTAEVLNEQETELNTMIAEGMECIRKLRDLNDKIPEEGISSKLFCLENLLKDIFDSLREHPDQMNRMHKLMNYYLPTTIKLVEAYEDFSRVSSPGKEIQKAKAEIENTLDTINQAFTELLNNLFQDAVFDVTTDAQVLKTMLAKEGLTKEMELVSNRQNSQETPKMQFME